MPKRLRGLLVFLTKTPQLHFHSKSRRMVRIIEYILPARQMDMCFMLGGKAIVTGIRMLADRLLVETRLLFGVRTTTHLRSGCLKNVEMDILSTPEMHLGFL